jgi:hypothetical protein
MDSTVLSKLSLHIIDPTFQPWTRQQTGSTHQPFVLLSRYVRDLGTEQILPSPTATPCEYILRAMVARSRPMHLGIWPPEESSPCRPRQLLFGNVSSDYFQIPVQENRG